MARRKYLNAEISRGVAPRTMRARNMRAGKCHGHLARLRWKAKWLAFKSRPFYKEAQSWLAISARSFEGDSWPARSWRAGVAVSEIIGVLSYRHRRALAGAI